MPIFVRTSSGTFPNGWTQIFNPRIRVSSSQWSSILAGDIYNGTTWDRFFVRITPVVPTVSNVSRTVTTLTFRYEHPGDTDTGSPVRIEYQLKNPNGTIRESGSQTFNSGAINQTVTFPLPGNSALTRNTTYTFEARAVYPDYNISTAFASISRTTEDINVVDPTVSLVQATINSLRFRVQHPGESQTGTRVRITRLIVDPNGIPSEPLTTGFITGPVDQEFLFSGLFSDSSYTFSARIDYSDYGLSSNFSSITSSTLKPPPTYQLGVPNPTIFSRGFSTTISVTTTNVLNNTTLYWRAINNDPNDLYQEFTNNAIGTVTIQNNSGSFTVNTNFLNVTPGSFHQTVTTTTNSFDWRARVSSIEGYRGNATFTVRLYTNSARTNQVATTSNITITPEPYNVSVQVTTGGNFVTQYFIPGQFSSTTNEVNDLRTISGLSPLTTYQVQVTTRYTSRSPLQTAPATAVTRSTFRNPDNLQGQVIEIIPGVFSLAMTARAGAIPNGTTGTGDCTVQFRLLRMSPQNNNVVAQFYPIQDAIDGVITTGNNVTRSASASMPQSGNYRFETRTWYKGHGSAPLQENNDYRQGPWIRSTTVFPR